MDIILLNGPSSAGKSSIARALKAQLAQRTGCRIIALDDYLPATSEEPFWEDDVYDLMPRMCGDLRAALDAGQTVIIDHVITSRRIWEAVCGAIGTHSCLRVLVTCDLSVLREREKARGDRYIGSSEASLTYLYPRDGYDLTVDSSCRTPADIAGDILARLS